MITPPFPPVTGQVPHAQTHWDAFVSLFSARDPQACPEQFLFPALRNAIGQHPDPMQRVRGETARVKLIQAVLNRSPATAIHADFATLDESMQAIWVSVAQRLPALNAIARGGCASWL